MNLKEKPNDSFAASSSLFANIFRNSKDLAELQQKEVQIRALSGYTLDDIIKLLGAGFEFVPPKNMDDDRLISLLASLDSCCLPAIQKGLGESDDSPAVKHFKIMLASAPLKEYELEDDEKKWKMNMRENIGLYRGKPKTSEDYFFFSQNWKDNCEEGFVYGNLIVSKGKYYICVSAMGKLNCCINNGTVSMIEVIPETVGEYTGLTDKNGKKIFEGDIIQSLKSSMTGLVQCFPEHSAFMVWCKSENEVGFLYECYDIIKVIGNIHDNPELLKGGAEE